MTGALHTKSFVENCSPSLSPSLQQFHDLVYSNLSTFQFHVDLHGCLRMKITTERLFLSFHVSLE
jgi:hypothetical protein